MASFRSDHRSGDSLSGKKEWGISSLVEGLGRLEFAAHRSFGTVGPGERPGRTSGGRSEFAGHGPYLPGADFRDIDWNLAARFDSLYVREYQREEATPVRLFIDSSASMSAPEPQKFEFTRQLAFGLGIVALARHHSVRVWQAWQERVEGGIRFEGLAARRRLREFLESMRSSGGLDLAGAIDLSCRVDPEPSLSIWLTDGYGGPTVRERLIRSQGGSREVVVLLVSSPGEIDPGRAGNVELVDAENGESVQIAIGEEERRRYQAEFLRHVEAWRAHCLRTGLRFAWVRSDEPLEEIFFGTLTRAGVLV